MLIRCLLLSVWRKSGPAQFCPSPSTKYNWCWKIWGGEKTDRVGKKLTGYFFLPGKKLTSQFLPRGRNGPAWSFPGERLAGGKKWPLHRGYIHVLNHKTNCIKSDFKGIFLKLASDEWNDKTFLLTLKLCPLGAVCPCPGAINMYKKKWKKLHKIRLQRDFFLKLSTNDQSDKMFLLT